jgi:hypothetical protein
MLVQLPQLVLNLDLLLVDRTENEHHQKAGSGIATNQLQYTLFSFFVNYTT